MKTRKDTREVIPQCTAEHRAELAKRWGGDTRMIDYCAKAEHAYMLPSGRIYTIEVPRIDTRFCFGYSMSHEDYEDAEDMARHARTREDYFLAENLRQSEVQRDIEDLTGECGHPRLLKHWAADTYTLVNVMPCDHIWRADLLFDLSEADKDFILAVLSQERAAFEKRLHTYLKRYGLSKVRTWTYWRDA